VKLLSWNVNGLRSSWKKGLIEVLGAEAADVVCLQETKLQAEQVTDEMRAPGGYSSHWAFAERPGYSGVVTYSRAAPLAARGYVEPSCRLYARYPPEFQAYFNGSEDGNLRPGRLSGHPMGVISMESRPESA